MKGQAKILRFTRLDKCYEKNNSVNHLYLIIDKINGYIE